MPRDQAALQRPLQRVAPGSASPQPAGPTLVLHLLGSACWQRWDGSGPLGAQVPLNWRDALLLAMLALDGAQPRDRIVSLLWPAAPTLQAGRLSLRQRLHRLRQATDHELVLADDVLQLCTSGLECDLWPAQWERSSHWPEGDLLEGMGELPPSHEALADWLHLAREQVSQRWQQTLAASCREAAQARDHGRTARLCRQWLQRWPWSEEQWRRLIEALYLAGNLAQAGDAIVQMRRCLADDLGVAPMEPTSMLVDTVERALRDRQRQLGANALESSGSKSGTASQAPTVGLPTATVPAWPERAAGGMSATRVLATLRTLTPQALSLARALAWIDQAMPGADRIPTAARILQRSVLELATPWWELEEAAVLHDGRIARPALQQALLEGIPAALRDHLLSALPGPGGSAAG